ncbi:hypothetical protein ACI2L1_24285 [Streptomyces sp. NPDC019531]|uniref:hypothetical protein n=1 Tax=Streptomyces sp. NPDC019531 TaxID=3365062 RepID=UPI00384DE425
MSHILLRTAVAAASVVEARVSPTACHNDDMGDAPAPTPAEQIPTGTPSSDTHRGPGCQVVSDGEDLGKGTDRSDKAYSGSMVFSGDEAASSSGTGVDRVVDKLGYGRGCATNGIVRSEATKSQAGHVLIRAKAKPGITCVLSGEYKPRPSARTGPKRAPRSRRWEGATPYTDVHPKTFRGGFGKLLKSVVVAVGDDPGVRGRVQPSSRAEETLLQGPSRSSVAQVTGSRCGVPDSSLR